MTILLYPQDLIQNLIDNHNKIAYNLLSVIISFCLAIFCYYLDKIEYKKSSKFFIIIQKKFLDWVFLSKLYFYKKFSLLLVLLKITINDTYKMLLIIITILISI